MSTNELYQRRTIPPRTVSEFVGFLVDQPENGECTWSVTSFAGAYSKLVRSLGENGEMRHEQDHFQRIKKCKEICYDEIKMIVQEAFFTPGQSLVEGEPATNLLRKNERASDLLRTAGNEHYKKKYLEKALRCYTLAGAYAPAKSELEALAHSNRSACFFEMGNFQKCLEDIKRFELICDGNMTKCEKAKGRLMERKLKCGSSTNLRNGENEIEMKLKNDFLEMLKLESPSREIPVAESSVGIRENGRKGKHLVNVGNMIIEPGTLLILEEPYAQISTEAFDFQGKHCSACFRDLGGSGVPCDGCVFALYCSEECATSPSHFLHSLYECKLIPFLYELNMGTAPHLSLQILFKLMSSGPFPEQITSLPHSSAPQHLYDPASYSSTIGNLISHIDHFSDESLLRYSMTSLVLTEILDGATDYFRVLSNGDHLKEVSAALLLSHQLTLPFNSHAHERLDLEANADSTQPLENYIKVGMAIFPLLSKMNHSCDPNTISITLPRGTKAVFTTQHIIPGQEITTGYLPHFMYGFREERMKNLEEHYSFKCDCPPCKLRWPGHSKHKIVGNFSSEMVAICPQCRFTLDAGDSKKYSKFSIIILEECGENLVGCPKCGWEIAEDSITKERDLYLEKLKAVHDAIHEGDAELMSTSTFQNSVDCLKYFDRNLLKPVSCQSVSVDLAWKALSLLVRKLF